MNIVLLNMSLLFCGILFSLLNLKMVDDLVGII
jgi:hypothetical protein